MAVQHIKIEALSPVYIGGAAEQHFQKDIDVFWENGMLYYVPEVRLAQYISEREIQFIVNGQFKDYKNALKKKGADFEKLALYRWNCPQKPSNNEVQSFIRNGQGLPFIPGSSLKGAVSSHLFKALHAGNKDNTNDQLKKIAGFLQLTDAHFPINATEIFPTKIFNLRKDFNDGTFEGGWKHSFKRDTTPSFKSSGFVTDYETLYKGATGYGRLKLVDRDEFTYKHKNVSNIEPKFNWWDSDDSFKELFQLITQNSRIHLEKERAFYNKYNQADFAEETIPATIQDLIQECENAQESTNTMILRLGGGSGFHSITGDHIHNDYTIDAINVNRGRSRGRRNNKDSAKSRKLAFQKKGESYELRPMGFVKITLIAEEEYTKGRAKITELGNENVNKSINELSADTPPTSPTPPKPAEPEWKNFEELKQGDVVDAEVVGKEGKRVKVKLFLNDYNTIHDFRYPAGIETGRLIRVQIQGFRGNGANRTIDAIAFNSFLE